MAQNSTVLHASIDDVWRVLSDPGTYAHWVVGAKEVRDVEGPWPAVGAKLHHSVGVGPIKIKDNTVVEEVVPGEYLRLRGRVRPIGTAIIELELQPHQDGTDAVMREAVVGGPASVFYGRLMGLLIKSRNVESLRRLEQLAQQQ